MIEARAVDAAWVKAERNAAVNEARARLQAAYLDYARQSEDRGEHAAANAYRRAADIAGGFILRDAPAPRLPVTRHPRVLIARKAAT